MRERDDQDTGLPRGRHSKDAAARDAVEGALRQALRPLAGGRLLVAASAGLDSTVLVQGLVELRSELELELCVGHVHHGLRGAEADADLDFVTALAQRLGLASASRHVDPHGPRRSTSSRDRPTLQESARQLRRDALRTLADELACAHIATAHHADDQAETLLMRLLRGTGPDGLAGIAPRSRDGRFVRPLLRVPRAALERYAVARGLRWREDGSNASDAYLRNRIRRHWLPALAEEFNPKLLRALGDLAEAQRKDAEWIEECVASEARRRFSTEGRWLRIDTTDWACLPEALARRLARSALARCGAGRHVTRRHLERMLAFFDAGRSGSTIELPGDLTLERLRHDRDACRLGPTPSGSDPRGAC